MTYKSLLMISRQSIFELKWDVVQLRPCLVKIFALFIGENWFLIKYTYLPFPSFTYIVECFVLMYFSSRSQLYSIYGDILTLFNLVVVSHQLRCLIVYIKSKILHEKYKYSLKSSVSSFNWIANKLPLIHCFVTHMY